MDEIVLVLALCFPLSLSKHLIIIVFPGQNTFLLYPGQNTCCLPSISKPNWFNYDLTTVHFVAVLCRVCNFEMVFRLPPDGSPLISVLTIGYIQSESRTVRTNYDDLMVPCRQSPADSPDFLQHMSLAENTAGPWFKHSVFDELRWKNAGRRPVRGNRKVLCQSFHPMPRTAV